MKSPDFIKYFLTIVLAPTASFIAINGSRHADGSQVTLGIAIITFLGVIWGNGGGSSGGGTHAK